MPLATAAPAADAPPPSFASACNAETASVHTLPAYTPSRWGNYSTEAEYLSALRAWVEDKQYAAPGDKSALVGFYGAKTMSQYADAPGLWGGKKGGSVGEGEGEGQGKGRRKSSLGEWLRRRRAGEA
ncbi:hypothetical protein MMC11_006258 [Xylographa trunciseda]|nr:hypothetical protein [Xylographa trunciseda]